MAEKHDMLVTEEEAQTIWALRNGTARVVVNPAMRTNNEIMHSMCADRCGPECTTKENDSEGEQR